MSKRALNLSEPWFSHDIDKPQIELSEIQPIHVWDVTHRQRGRSSFDMHYGLEMGLVLSGRVRRYYPRWQGDLGAGQIWFCGIWEPHGYEVLQTPCRKVSVVLLPQLLARLRFEEAPDFSWLAPFVTEPSHRPQTPTALKRHLCRLGSRIVEAAQDPRDSGRVLLRLLVLEALFAVRRNWTAEAPGRRADAGDHALIEKALTLLFARRGRLTTLQAARACCVSRNTFARGFRATMGLAFSEFALRYRLSGARSQLLAGAAVKEVAFAWGFSDASHFCRCFRAHFGKSPLVYRRTRVRNQGG